MKRWSLLLTIAGSLLSGVSFYLIFFVYRNEHITLTLPFFLISVITMFTSPAFGAFNLPEERRKKVANRILVVALALIACGCVFKYMDLPSARIQIILGVLLFTFTYGTLTLKNKFDKWKLYTRSKRLAFLYSLFDFMGTGMLFLGTLFWFQNWPLYTVFIVFGATILAISTFAWNHTFRGEVVYRKNAEDQLQLQKIKLEEKQKEITDSITYAKRIQHSLLAHDELLKKGLGDHFVLYLPKDIVSGDFYWATETNDSFYLAVCDSTGHGVPGAFMSLLNTTFLNEAINEKSIVEPNLIFEHVRKQLIANISQQGGQDGMDGILLRIAKKSGEITYAGANNAPIIVRNGETVECLSDKMPVGIGERMDSYAAHKLSTTTGDMIYLATDGYADQFGGAKGKKMKRSGLKTLLIQHAHLSSTPQRNQLESSFTSWRGDLEQLDDVCIIGIRIQ